MEPKKEITAIYKKYIDEEINTRGIYYREVKCKLYQFECKNLDLARKGITI